MKNIKRSIIDTEPKHQYLSDLIETIPANAILAKGVTGCGGTTLEIECDRHSIITVPFVNVIKNKKAQHPDLIAVYGKVTKEEIGQTIYMRMAAGKKVKIMTTYDSLAKVIAAMPKSVSPYQAFFLLVDEYHLLFTQYRFRNEAIFRLLEQAKLFDNVTYMSATPIKDEFVLDELKHLPIIEINWCNSKQVRLRAKEARNPRLVVRNMINKKLSGKVIGNLHFFYNSVRAIAKTIKELKLDAKDVKVVCANTEENKRKLGKHYKIEDDLLTPKTINFYTSTVFEGADILDPDGKTIVVSDASNKYTLQDIATTIPQICGRIRDSKFKGTITHIYHPTKNKYKKYDKLEDFLSACDVIEQEGLDEMAIINKHNDEMEEMLKVANALNKVRPLTEVYIRLDPDSNEIVVHDPNLKSYDIYNYMLIAQIYATKYNMDDAYKQAGIDAIDVAYPEFDIADAIVNGKKPSFKESYLNYCKLMDEHEPSEAVQEAIENIELYKPLVKEAYEKLDPARVRKCEYKPSRIRLAILNLTELHKNKKLSKAVDEAFEVGNHYENQYIKQELNRIYQMLGVNRTAAASHLSNWFNVRKGKAKKGFDDLSGQTIYKDGYLISGVRYP